MAGMKIEQTPFISCVFQPASFTIYHRAALIKFFIPPGLYIPVKEKIEGFVGEKIVRRYGGKIIIVMVRGERREERGTFYKAGVGLVGNGEGRR